MERINAHIRWMIPRDMPDVYAIEDLAFRHPWGEDDFIPVLRQRNNIVMVVEFDEQIIGFVAYELRRYEIELLRMAVCPAFQRLGVGSQIIDKIKSKLTPQRRNRLIIKVPESNLDALMFLKSHGFIASNLFKNWYLETDDDAIQMEYVCHNEVSTDFLDKLFEA